MPKSRPNRVETLAGSIPMLARAKWPKIDDSGVDPKLILHTPIGAPQPLAAAALAVERRPAKVVGWLGRCLWQAPDRVDPLVYGRAKPKTLPIISSQKTTPTPEMIPKSSSGRFGTGFWSVRSTLTANRLQTGPNMIFASSQGWGWFNGRLNTSSAFLRAGGRV